MAAWLIEGGGELRGLGILCLGASLLYLAGMYLNDAFDIEFDKRYRPERPIPSGLIPPALVWCLGAIWMIGGLIVMIGISRADSLLCLCLVASILLYNWLHKGFAHAPILMAMCRLFLFLAVASSVDDSVSGRSVWSAVMLAAYVVGLSYVARQESLGTPLQFWPCLLLGAPIIYAYFLNGSLYRVEGILFSLIVLVWTIWSLRFSFWTGRREVGKTVSGLLAGIVLVDLLAILGQPLVFGLTMGGLFVLALLFQRYIPAT